MKVLTKTRVYPHSIEDVWTAITDARALAEWLMPNDFQPVLGSKFRMMVDPNPMCNSTRTEGEVVELNKPTRMVWVWRDFDAKGKVTETRVIWELQSTPDGTRLTLRHENVQNLSFFTRLMVSMGWGMMMKNLLTKVLRNVQGGAFTPGAVPLNKRYYKAKTIPADLVK